MSSCEAYEDPEDVSTAVANICPCWCAVHHVGHGVEERGDLAHISGALLVKRTVLRLAASIDPDTGAQDGPVVYVGDEEYTLYQAEVLIDALMHLVDQGTHGTAVGTGRRPAQKLSDGR
jgi:hypothetical protein